MASARQCITCSKSTASMYCIGCDKYFCTKDFRGHREGMLGEMDNIVEGRNQLQEAINNSVEGGDQNSPIIAEIENWEKKTIKKVQEVAARAREQTIQLLNANRVKIQTEFKSFSQELAALKESEDFVEHDLARLNKLLSQFKTDIQQARQPITIKFHTEQSDKINWETLIFVEEIRSNNNQQQQQKMIPEPPIVAPPAQIEPKCPNYMNALLAVERAPNVTTVHTARYIQF